MTITDVSNAVARARLEPAVVATLVCSAILLTAAPLALPGSYSWVEHTTSEAGAQGVDGAWVARSGFVLFGLGVAGVVAAVCHRWNRLATVMHGMFAGSMFLVAVFPTRSWVAGAEFDTVADSMHSIAATTMGFAFAIGVTSVAAGRRRVRVVDVVAIGASVLVPLAMVSMGSIDGALQRAMFAVAYVWYGRSVIGTENQRHETSGRTER